MAATTEAHPGSPRLELLRVSSRSNPNAVAGAIAGSIRHSGAVDIQIVGAGALNQATKAAVIARGILSTAGLEIVVIPTFAEIEIDGVQRTALRLHLEDRLHRMPEMPLATTADSEHFPVSRA